MIKWGLIGCGNVCEVKSGPAFYKCDGSSLVAVMCRTEVKAKDFAKRHNVSKYYTDADALINDPEVDIVYVATPPDSHAELAIKTMKAGKPVYVEKPMATTYEECKLMIEASKKYNQKLFVAYYRRRLPYFLKIKEILDSGVIGKVQVVKGEYFRQPSPSDLKKETQNWRLNKSVSGGGYIYDVGSHTIDILMFLLGNIVHAKGITTNVSGLYEVEDTVSASFLFESGAVGSAIWSYASSALQQRKDILVIIGEKGSIEFSTFAFTDIILKTENNEETFDISPPQHIQSHLIQSIIDELNNKGKAPSTGETAALTNKIIEEII
ncbi:1,5-anhydro-D-fructose reductase (1,5-anhydro-D-mannitol-forming) [Dysgonomonadaceae bacterium PH5-43]|nr:1,5-anhydro-D-fructose reductase (1,5-anhydro-D-mannitol-forming) [Dysgonomonadaceae bacterium PH5-43]